MDPTRGRWGGTAESSLRAAVFWALLAGTLAIPLWDHHLEFGLQARARQLSQPYAPATPSNRAAVCVAQWIRTGQLTGFRGRSPAVCLRVPAREWAALSCDERAEIWRDITLLGEMAESGRPLVVRDEQDHVLVAGRCRDEVN